MEPSPSSASASSPSVYAPISHPDSPVPTYAVLQFVGFSESSIQNPSFPQAPGILQLASSPSSGNRSPGGPCTAANPNFSSGKPYQQDACAGHPYTHELCAGNRSPAGSTAAENPNSRAAGNRRLCAGNPSREGACAAAKSSSQGYFAENPIPEDSCTGNPSPQGSCTSTPDPKTFCAENPSARSGCADSNSCNSVSKSIDKKVVSIKSSPMKKSGVTGAGAACSGGKKSNKGLVVTAAAISVSHTDRETIVHTHCSNFREVVHQLTGASSEDTDLLPVTVPARLPVNRGGIDGSGNGGDVNRCINNHETVVRSEFAGRVPPRRQTTTKLFERRRSSKTLERLSTSCRDLPPLVPSPVTPLASDFEKICLPLTPTVSPSSMTVMPLQERNAVQIHPTLNQQRNAIVHMYPTYNQPAINMYSTINQPQISAVEMYLAASQPQGAAVQTSMAMSQHQASAEDLDTAGKGFLLHLQRPRNSEPTLLPLFPESPRDQ